MPVAENSGKRVLGYVLRGPDNDSHMLYGSAPHPECAGCGWALDYDWIDPSFRLGRDRYDISFTYDLYCIVSDNFRHAAGNRGARFIPLPSERGFHSLRVDEQVAFDAVRRRTRFGDLCPVCHRYESVAGATPAYLIGDPVLPDRFFRTDVEFGGRNHRNPLILVGVGLGDELRKHKLRGLRLLPIDSQDDSIPLPASSA
jgi:hypothetical protein